MIADPDKKTLIIVESPTKARTIGKYLPSTCTVMASRGHVVELAPEPKNSRFGVDIDNGYELEYQIEDDKKKILDELKKALKGKEQLVLATDEDREGESISWHLYNQLKPKCPVFRMVFHEITKQAITNAFSSCREIDMDLVHAQEARRAVDRLQGYGISPIISRKLGGKYSAGRVQSPGLKLIVEREKTRRLFSSSDYASVEAMLVSEGATFPATLTRIDDTPVASSKSFDSETGKIKGDDIILTHDEAERIASELSGSDVKIEGITYRDIRQNPAKPFTTSTLQQDASRKLRKGVREIMAIAQTLYENGFITYMRTDSPTLSQECINASRMQVEEMFGQDYLSYKPRNYKATGGNAQEAHEAIRPAGDRFRRPEETGLEGDQLKLYTLIWRRTLATQMREAEKSSVSAVFHSGRYTLTASGTSIKFPGYLKLYEVAKDTEEEEGEEGILPSLDPEKSRVSCSSAGVKDHTTEPPARFNEATLVQKLEGEGIGRPSTYATIISTLIDRKYVIRKNQQLVPTFTGFFVDSFLESMFPVYIGYGFTSEMESGLDKIADGTESKQAFLDGFWKGRDGFPGLARDLASVTMNARRSEVKNLTLSGLSYKFSTDDGTAVAYAIKTGKFGPYLSSDSFNEETGKDRMASIDQAKYFPGTFMDEDAKAILFPPQPDSVPVVDDIFIMSGRYGEYFRRESDGKIVNIARRKSAASYSPDMIRFLFTLPKSIGKDSEGNDVMLVSGPYGIYAQYKGQNINVQDPFTADAAAIIENAEAVANGAPKNLVRKYEDYEGKPLEMLRGRYGAYIKWGDLNCALSAADKRDLNGVDQARAEEIAKAASEKPPAEKKRRTTRRTAKSS